MSSKPASRPDELTPDRAPGQAGRRTAEPILAALRTLIDSLPKADQERLAREINDKLRASTSPGVRSGEVLGKIIELLPRQRSWKAAELKQLVEDSGVSASPKEVYNAINYLARRGNLQRVGYGLYLFEGGLVATADDLGGERGRYEDVSYGFRLIRPGCLAWATNESLSRV